MILTVGDIIKAALKKGMTDSQILALSGRTHVTLWRWKHYPERGFDFDEGMRKLIKALNDD